MSDDLAYATATELAARIRRRDLSPVEVVDAVIARIEARDPSLNASSSPRSTRPASRRRGPSGR